MKPAASYYDEPVKERGFSRMIVVSALMHVVVIGGILAFTQSSSSRRDESLPSSYEVTLVSPQSSGRNAANGNGGSTAPLLAKGNGTPLLPRQREQSEPLASKVETKPKTVKSPRPPAKASVAEKVKEPAKVVPPPKIQTAVVAKEKEPVKPKVKEEPRREPEKQKSSTKTKPLEEKKEKNPPPEKSKTTARIPAKPQPERVKPVEQKAKGETPPPQTKSKPQMSETKVTKPQKKVSEPKENPKETKETSKEAKEKTPTPKKTTDTTKDTQTVPTQKVAPTPVAKKVPVADTLPKKEEKEKNGEDAQEREERIAAAIENVRGREEKATRDSGIAQALERVRKRIAEGKGDDGVPGEKMASRSQGQGPSGKSGGATKTYGAEFIAYTENIKQRVKDGWLIPERRPGLAAIIRFAVEPDGRVVDVELVEPSGDPAFDQSALRAVRTANLPPPPEAYREEFAVEKVQITFKGEE
ncbi:MAG: TonB family protein [Candidatus Binatia bacterium]